MRYPLSASTLLLTFLLTTCTYGYSWRCTNPNVAPVLQYARVEQCAQAIMTTFPSTTEEGWFHRGGDPDMFRLPRTAMYGDCKVVVDLAASQSTHFESSWSAIWSMALMLKDACIFYPPGPALAGTVWTAGSLNAGIIIRIGRYGYISTNMTEDSNSGDITLS